MSIEQSLENLGLWCRSHINLPEDKQAYSWCGFSVKRYAIGDITVKLGCAKPHEITVPSAHYSVSEDV